MARESDSGAEASLIMTAVKYALFASSGVLVFAFGGVDLMSWRGLAVMVGIGLYGLGVLIGARGS